MGCNPTPAHRGTSHITLEKLAMPDATLGSVLKVLQKEVGHGSHQGVLGNPVKREADGSHDPRCRERLSR